MSTLVFLFLLGSAVVPSCSSQSCKTQADEVSFMQTRMSVQHGPGRAELPRAHIETAADVAAREEAAQLLQQGEAETSMAIQAVQTADDLMQGTVGATHSGQTYSALANPDAGLQAVFDNIANTNMWGSNESVSGQGSELVMTAPIRQCLGEWIQKYNVKTFVDSPCGDANWQGQIPGIDSVEYKGYDIAEKPIQLAAVKNAAHKSMSFGHLDLTSGPPAEQPDFIMVRDVIQHLPVAQGMQMLVNAKKSGAKFLVVSNYYDGDNSEGDIPLGSLYKNKVMFYKNNVHAPPFNIPSRLEACQNYGGWAAAEYPTNYLELIDLSSWNPPGL